MKNILVIGAGRSATVLIRYLLDNAVTYDWFITVADLDPQLAMQKTNGHPRGRGVWLDVTKSNDRKELIARADLVITMIPAHLHLELGQDCIKLNKTVITSAYISNRIYTLGEDALNSELSFIYEKELTPSLEHSSAKKEIDEIKAKGGKITSFRSYSGGLITKESDDNPWRYKITWDPKNVVYAGEGTAQYLENGKLRCFPHSRVFDNVETVNITDFGKLEAYPSRDGILHRSIYGLEGVPNIYRGTLRYPGFSKAWAALVKLGLTDDKFPILEADKMTYHEWMESYVEKGTGSVKDRVAEFLGETPNSKVMRQLQWLGLFRKKRINLKLVTPATILENLLLDKWKMKDSDKDLLLMQHEITYELEGKTYLRKAVLHFEGEDANNTAMSQSIGYPVAIMAKLYLADKLEETGIHVPLQPKVYNVILDEMKEYGIEFKVSDTLVN